MKKIGTHNDNFLSSFISIREFEEKQTKAKTRPRNQNIPLDEAWFREITNASFESEMDEKEYKNLVRNLLPEFFEHEEQPQSELKQGNRIVETPKSDSEKLKRELQNLVSNKENQQSSVTKWRKAGVE